MHCWNANCLALQSAKPLDGRRASNRVAGSRSLVWLASGGPEREARGANRAHKSRACGVATFIVPIVPASFARGGTRSPREKRARFARRIIFAYEACTLDEGLEICKLRFRPWQLCPIRRCPSSRWKIRRRTSSFPSGKRLFSTGCFCVGIQRSRFAGISKCRPQF